MHGDYKSHNKYEGAYAKKSKNRFEVLQEDEEAEASTHESGGLVVAKNRWHKRTEK